MVESALDKGFTALGFSCHSHLPFAPDWTVSLEGQEKYIAEIDRLKKLYGDRISIFCGIEQDYFSPPRDKRYEYSIGSVHFLCPDGEFIPLDTSEKIFTNAVREYYGGDYDALAHDYFELVGDVINKTDADIIGHFDLITKYNEKTGQNLSAKYFSLAEEAVKKLIPYGKPFEINTGAIARGHRTSPYPAPEILEMIRDLGGRIIFSSDCHNKDLLDCYYPEAQAEAKALGFKSHCVITCNGTEEIPL